jgi:hypothetical protein
MPVFYKKLCLIETPWEKLLKQITMKRSGRKRGFRRLFPIMGIRPFIRFLKNV